MHRRVLASAAVWSDDTRDRYRVPGRTTAAGHLWVTVGDPSAPYTTLHFTRGYAAVDGPDVFLAGCVHADCLAQYDGVFAAGEPAALAVELVGRCSAVVGQATRLTCR